MKNNTIIMSNKKHIPWVEKYRPTSFNSIVLDPTNKIIMETILKTHYFPNLLLYGPPGTGKTTTIINLVNEFQNNSKGLMIHLNASDERGIDIIRNQINQFVNSKSLFQNGTKFVILDEVDYMTKNAQQALKYLLRGINGNVRFCLICNYITRIDESLQNEFMRLRFNQLPIESIIKFLSYINKNEKLKFTNEILYSIQKLYKSDIRSMINHMQSNQNLIDKPLIINNDIWDNLLKIIQTKNKTQIIDTIDNISNLYNIEIKNIIKDFLNYIIRNKSKYISKDFLKFSEFITHIHDVNINNLKSYLAIKLKKILV